MWRGQILSVLLQILFSLAQKTSKMAAVFEDLSCVLQEQKEVPGFRTARKLLFSGVEAFAQNSFLT